MLVVHVCLMSSHPRFDNSVRWSQIDQNIEEVFQQYIGISWDLRSSMEFVTIMDNIAVAQI